METFTAAFAVLAAIVAFWSAGNVERLKLNFDKVRRAYDLYYSKEYELYEDVYPKMLGAYNALIEIRRMDSDLDPLEQLEIELDGRTERDVRAAREVSLSRALTALAFKEQIERKEPLVPSEVYEEIKRFWEMGFDKSFTSRYPSLYKPPMKADKRDYSAEELEIQLKIVCNRIRDRLLIQAH